MLRVLVALVTALDSSLCSVFVVCVNISGLFLYTCSKMLIAACERGGSAAVGDGVVSGCLCPVNMNIALNNLDTIRCT